MTYNDIDYHCAVRIITHIRIAAATAKCANNTASCRHSIWTNVRHAIASSIDYGRIIRQHHFDETLTLHIVALFDTRVRQTRTLVWLFDKFLNTIVLSTE